MTSRVRQAAWLVIIVQGLLAVWISKPWMTADTVEYLKLAHSLAHGSYGSDTLLGFQPDVLRPPGYPLILFALRGLLALPDWAVSLIQVVALWLSIFLCQRMLERFGIEPAPMLVLAAIYPFPALYSANLMTEAWSALALTAAAAVITLSKRTMIAALCAGLLSGAAVLLRADMALLPVAVAIAIFWGWGTQSLPRRAGQGAAALVGALIAVTPYMAWNFEHFGNPKPLPLAGALGNSLYIATWQPVLPRQDIDALYSGVVTPKAEAAGLGNEVRAMNAQIGAPLQTAPWNPASYGTRAMQVASTRYTMAMAKQRIAADPGNYAGHVVANVWSLWNTSNYPARIPRAVAALLILSSALVYVLAAAGILLTTFRPAAIGLPRWLLPIMLYVPAIHVFLHTEARYTAPARPLFLLFAGAFAALAIRRRDRIGKAPMPAPSPHS